MEERPFSSYVDEDGGPTMQNSTRDVIQGSIVIGALVYGYFALTDTPDTRPITNTPLAEESSRPLMPDDRDQLIAIVAKNRRAFLDSNNDVERGLIRKRRGEEICTALTSRFFKSWIGVVHKVSTSLNGQEVSNIEVDLVQRSIGGNLSIVDRTNYPPGSRIHTIMLNDVKEGDMVFVDGEFRYDNDSLVSDCFYETSLSMSFGMDSPSYQATFADIRPVSAE